MELSLSTIELPLYVPFMISTNFIAFSGFPFRGLIPRANGRSVWKVIGALYRILDSRLPSAMANVLWFLKGDDRIQAVHMVQLKAELDRRLVEVCWDALV